MRPILLVAHGSADPRAAAATRALARSVAKARARRALAAVGAGSPAAGAASVRVSFLDHAGPRPGEVLFELAAAGFRSATVVPLLMTSAYHVRVDLPAVLDEARAEGLALQLAVCGALGPVGGRVPQQLVAGLRRRLGETGVEFDAVVLAAAGTRDAAARSTVGLAARVLGARLGVPAMAAYASASGPTAGEAVATLRAAGARRVAVSGYFLAPGRLYDTAIMSARAEGAVAAAGPLTDAPELAELVLDRAAAARTWMSAMSAPLVVAA